MTTTETKYATRITQNIGGNYQAFKNINNAKTSKGYTETEAPITSKKGNKNRPSTLYFEKFKFNIPSDAEVTRVTVNYKISKIGVCTKNKTQKPCSTAKKQCNVGAPKIILTNKVNETPKTFLGSWELKGKAPTTTPTKQTLTFNIKRNSVPYWFWNNKFYVTLNLPKNTNTNEGYIRVYYLTVKITYVRPSYSINLQKVSGGYNNEELHLKAIISNKNLTRYNPQVTITSPLGFTYKRKNGDGTINKINNRTFTWTPKVGGKGNSSIELVFDTNVTYSSNDKTYEATFTAGVPTYNLTKELTTIIKEKPADPDTLNDTTDNDTYSDTDSQPDTNNRVWATLNEQFNLILQFTPEEIERYSNNGILYTNFQGYKEETKSGNWYYIDNNGTEHQLTDNMYIQVQEDTEYTFDGSFTVKNTYGDYSLKVYGLVGGGTTQELIRELVISIRPPVNTLDTPNMTILSLTEEELNRLGDYTYIVQSNMKLTCETEHINDWLRNHRIGVFNNRIEANCTDYILLQSSENTQDRELSIPARYNLTDCTCEIGTDNPIIISLDNGETTYDVTESIPVPLDEEYNIPVILSGNSPCNIEIRL